MDLLFAPLAVVLASAGMWFATAPGNQGSLWVFVALLIPNAVLAALAGWRMYRDGTLLDLFRWRQGDITFGGLLALGLGLGVYVGRMFLFPPGGPADLWVVRLYLQIGSVPTDVPNHALMALAVISLALLEELGWRGLVQQVIEERVGHRKGWIITALLYTLAHLPAVFRLDAIGLGKNPLPIIGAMLTALVFGFVAGRIQRLPPVLIGHALLSYALTTQIRLWK